MGRVKRKVFRPIFGRDITSSSGRRTQERIDDEFRAAQELYDINAEKYRASAITNLRDSGGFEGLNEAEKQIAIDKEIANIMPKGENPFADISSNPETEGAIQQDEKRAKAKGDDYGLLDKAEVWMNASMNKLLANATQSVKAGSDVIRGASDYFFSGNDVSPNYMLSDAVQQEGKGALYSIFGAGNKYLAETVGFADRAIQGAEASLASRGMDSGFWHAASDMVGQWGFTYGGMATAALGRLGGAFSGLGSLSKSVTAAARWAKASEYTRKMFSASSLFYGALSEAAVESYGVSKSLEEAKGSQLAQLRDMMQKDFDQDFYSYERKYGAIKFSDFVDTILASSGMDPRLKREVASVLLGESKNPSASAVAAANAIVSQYKTHAEEAVLKNASDEIDQRNGLASGWTAGLNTVLLTFMNKYTYELATDKLAGANRLKKAGRFGALGSTLINASAEGIEEVVQGGISKGAENIGKRSVDEMLRASTISERNSTSIGILGSLAEIGKGMWDTTTSASTWTDEALPAIVSTLLMPMYKGSKFANDGHRTDAFGDARQTKKSWLSKLYDGSPIGISGVERYRDYKYSGGKQRTSDEAIEAMTKMVNGRHEQLTNEEKKVMTEVFGQNYAEVVHETYQSVVDAMASADRMNALLARVAQSTTADSADVEAAEELTKAHNVATMLSVMYNSSIGQANFSKRNFGQWTSDMMRSTREFGADMGHAISSLLGANTEEKETRYQAAVAKREADRAAREEARRSESDPFAEVPDNLRPFLNFLDIKETDEATLVSIARQRIENTLDPEEKKKMEEAYFQGEGSDKLTEKAIEDIAGEINKQKHTLADIATDYSNTRRFLDLTSKPGEFSGREKSRVAAAAASFNHLRRLASEHLDAMEGEVAGLYKEISDAAESRLSELLKDREAMRDNLNTDDEQRKSQLEANIKAIDQEIAALEREMRHIEEMQKKNQERGKQNYSNTLGGWEEFMKRFEDFEDLSLTYIRAADIADNKELAQRLAELTQDNEKMSENGKLAIKFAKEAMAGIESINKMLEDKKARENLVARATEEEEAEAEAEGEDMVGSGDSEHTVDEVIDQNADNGVTPETSGAMQRGAARAASNPEVSALSKFKTAIRNTIEQKLMDAKFMQILSSYGIEGSDAVDFIRKYAELVSNAPSGTDNFDYIEYMIDAARDMQDPDLANNFFGFANDELFKSIGEWISNNKDKFPEDPTTPIQAIPSKPARPDGDRNVDSIEFDKSMEQEIGSVSVGGVTVLKSRVLDRLQDLLGSDNALVDLLQSGNGSIDVSITFNNGYATIDIAINTRFGWYNSSARLSYDDLRNRLQPDVSLSVLAADIVDVIFNANEKALRDHLNSSSEDYKNRDEKSKREQDKDDDDQDDDDAPIPANQRANVHEGPSTTPPAPPVSSGNSATLALPKVESLSLWDEYNPGLKEAKLATLSTEWQEKIRKWYEEKNVGLNLKNAKGKEIFYGFTEELSENDDVSNSPLVIYVKDEQDQFVPIGLLPTSTSGNTQVLINNARAVATEDKKFDIFSSSDLNAPKATISKVKYSPFEDKRARGDEAIDAEDIENGVEEELKRGQVAISVTAFPDGNGGVIPRITIHNDALASESSDAINKLLTEKKGFLKDNYGLTYLVVVPNGANGPKPILVGIKGKTTYMELKEVDLEAEPDLDDEVYLLADEYLNKLAERFMEEQAKSQDGKFFVSGNFGEKYPKAFGDNLVGSIRVNGDNTVTVSFSDRLYDEEKTKRSREVTLDVSRYPADAFDDYDNIRYTVTALIDWAASELGIEERRIALHHSLMGNKEEVEDFIKKNMRMTEVRSEAGFEALSDGAVDEEGNETTPEPTSPPQGPDGTQPTATPAPRVAESAVGKPGESDGPFGSATENSLDKIKDKLAEDLANQGYDTVVKSSTSPHIAASSNGRIYMFEINAVDGSHKQVEWSKMHPTLKADAFALINSAQASDFKVSDRGRLFEYGDELSGTTHTIVVRRSTKGASTRGKRVDSSSNADRVIALAGKKKHEIAEAIKVEPTLRGLILELAAKGVTSSTPLYFSQHTINGNTYGGGHKVILQAKDTDGNLHSVEVEIDNEFGAEMDKIAAVVRERSVKKVAEGFAMISDVKMKDPNKKVITGEADIVFFRNDEGQTQAIVADVKSTAIPSKDSSPREKIKEKDHDGVRLIEKYKDQVSRYENHIKSLGINIAEKGYLIAVGYSTLDEAAVVEEASLKSEDIKVDAKPSRRMSEKKDAEVEEREALLPFERGDVFKEVHDVARLLPQGSLYQALRIYTGVAEVAPGVWGRYRDGIIEVASGASAGTLYHEAMHFIYEKLLTDADRGMLVSGLSEVTEEQIREIFGNQIPIAYTRDVRELSAELFRLWMQTKGDKAARKALEEKITRLAPKKKGFWGRLQALWERIKAALGYTPKSSIVSVLTGIEGGNYSHVSVASRVNATNLSSPIEGAVESMLRYGLMSEDDFNNAYNPYSVLASRNMAQLVYDRFMAIAYDSLKVLEEGLGETEHAGRVRRMEATFDDAVAVLRDAAEFSEDAMHAVEIIDELGLDGNTRTLQEMDALEERTDNLLGQTLAGCR